MKRDMSVALAILLLLAASTPSMAAGPVEAGIKGGVNIASQTADPDDGELADSRTGLALGGFVGIPVLPSVKIQPEALFMMKGDEASEGGQTMKMNYIEVPVLAKIGFMAQSPAHPTIFAGPSLGINMAAEYESDTVAATDVKDNTKSVDFGVVVGAGVDFQNVGVDVRYTRGLTNVSDVEGSDTTVNNSVISIMGSFRFL